MVVFICTVDNASFTGYPTFGYVGESIHISSITLEAWAGVLKAVPRAHLLLAMVRNTADQYHSSSDCSNSRFVLVRQSSTEASKVESALFARGVTDAAVRVDVVPDCVNCADVYAKVLLWFAHCRIATSLCMSCTPAVGALIS